MNSKILKLAEQAGGFPLYPDRTEGDVTMGFRERALERLVDMVVQECVTVIEGSPWNLPHGYKAVDQAALVKKHFGVKE